MLPHLKRSLKLPRDHALLQKLEATVRLVISSELDTEASVFLREAVDELDQVNVSMEVVSEMLCCVVVLRIMQNMQAFWNLTLLGGGCSVGVQSNIVLLPLLQPEVVALCRC